jgi:ketosteroid isomerase-like protein
MEEARRDAGVTDPALAVIRQVNEAIAAGDPRSAADHFHPDVVWEHNIGTGSPEEGVYTGRDNVMQLLERVVETWEYLRAEPRNIDRLDDARYHVVGDLRAKHRTSDMEIVASYDQHLEIRDKQLVKGSIKTGEISFK